MITALKKSLNDEICAEGGKTKFVELAGKSVSAGLSNSVKFRGQSGCVFHPKCNISPSKDCRTSRSVYEVECNECTQDGSAPRPVYFGTSARILHVRQLEHEDAIRRKVSTHALYKHQKNQHRDNPTVFRSRPIKGDIQYNLDRFILEGHTIQSAREDSNQQILNQRSEWGHRGLPRANFQQ